MTRQNLIVVALGGLAISAATIPAAQSQTGHALVLAERACLDQGVTPTTAAFNTCVVRAARAYDRGDPSGAQLEAQRTGAAHATCRSYGLAPETMGYRQCIANHTERRAAVPTTTVRTYRIHTSPIYPAYYDDYVVGPQIAVP